jgi:hypothetical protein
MRRHLLGMGDDASFIQDFSLPGSPTEPISPQLYQVPDTTVDPSLFDIQYGAPGVAPSAGTYEAAAAGDTSSGSNWLSSLFSSAAGVIPKLALPPGPSPRVNVPVAKPFTMSSIFGGGMSNVLIYGIGAVLLFSLVGGGGRRRR